MATETAERKQRGSTENNGAKNIGTQLKKEKKLEIKRVFTYPNKDPYESVKWGFRTAVAGDFRQEGVEAPICWSDSAVGIVSKLYFATIEGKRESSVKTLIKRVVRKITDEGINHKYFDEENAFAFEAELAYILINQIAAFNSPVWFNFGVPGRKQCASACYLLNVEDHLLGKESITEWISIEAAIFKSGAGAGVNLSKLRGSKEPLSTGGFSSGPVSFMRAADASCGSVKSGNTRRGARLVCLDVDHPDILDFIDSKVREDKRMRILSENGINMDPSTTEGERNIAECTTAQNANISVRLSDKFMEAVEKDGQWVLMPRTNYSAAEGEFVSAKKLLKKIAEAAWQCADPGVMFDDTINFWHTTPSLGRINTANPCIESNLNDNCSCNLASLNLVKFIGYKNKFYFKTFYQAVDIMITAMDITCSFSEAPTKLIEENNRNLRQLGLGYSNLGAALMIQGMPYDSDEGRDWAASVTSLMTGRAYKRSAELAGYIGCFAHYSTNIDAMEDVVKKHQEYSDQSSDNKVVSQIWQESYNQYQADFSNGFRNSQVTVIAPTGTISFMMDCDTTGAEPLFSPITYKKLAGGGMMEQTANCYTEAIDKYNYVDGANIWQTASINHSLKLDPIPPDGHLKMIAAIQPHISGAISKTINCPEDTTIDEIYDMYLEAWKMGVKSVAVYRDGSKATQVLSTEPVEVNTKFHDESEFNVKIQTPLAQNPAKEKSENNVLQYDIDNDCLKPITEEDALKFAGIIPAGNRRRLDDERKSITHKFSIAEHEGYITAGMYSDNTLGEIFLSGIGKEGSTLKGVLEGWAIAVSMGLQYGVPLASFAQKFSHMSFEPNGLTSNPEIRNAHSILDYVMRWLISKFGDHEQHEEFGVMTTKVKESKTKDLYLSSYEGINVVGKMCSCGAIMNRTGTCYTCSSCGNNTGCG